MSKIKYPVFAYRIATAFSIAVHSFMNLEFIEFNDFLSMQKLQRYIKSVVNKGSPLLVKIANVHSDKIATIWIGIGMGSSPMKRIEELAEENRLLREEMREMIKEDK